MGAAQSSNVSNAVTNVSNFVSNSTNANADQVSAIETDVTLNNCDIVLSGDFNVSSVSDLTETNTQIISGLQDANLNNNIQQQMLQEATSKVGFMGIGYASASNASNQMVNSTTTITNNMKASATQVSNQNQTFTCDRSTIIADNIDIGFYSNSDFLSSQTLNNTQTAKIVNKVSQTVTQKATATVEGIGSLLLGFLLIVAVIIYAISKPLSSGAGKVAVSIGLLFGISALIVFMYIRNTPPFFAEPSNCLKHSAIGRGNESDVSECINLQKQKINLNNPPLKYTYPILPKSISTTGGNLLQIAISACSGQSKSNSAPNGGYTVKTFLILQNKINNYYNNLALTLGVRNVPNPLKLPNIPPPTGFLYFKILDAFLNNTPSSSSSSVCTPATMSVGDKGGNYISKVPITVSDCSQNGSFIYDPSILSGTNDPSLGIANLADDDWNSYIENASDLEKHFARFVLCDIIGGMDLHYYVDSQELVKFLDENNNIQLGQAQNFPDDSYEYHPETASAWEDEIQGSGYLYGYVGVNDDNQYRFNKFMKNIGIWIIVGILALVFMYMGYNHFMNKKQGKLTDLKKE
jgi:hypothetical protein